MTLVVCAEIRPKMVHFPQTKTFYREREREREIERERERVTTYFGSNHCSVVWNLKEIIWAVQQTFRSKDIKMPHFGPQMPHFPWT